MKSKTCSFSAAQIVTEFCDTTTIHGPIYLARGHVLNRVVWALVMVVMFACAWVLIRDSVREWEEQPVVINFGLKSIPITKVPVR